MLEAERVTGGILLPLRLTRRAGTNPLLILRGALGGNDPP